MQTSIVIPVYNDPEGLRTTVESLTDQTATDYEVVIADNGSTDGTTAVAREYAREDYVSHVVEDETQGSYAARNAGIEAASGDVIGFLDADMWVEEDYVEAITAKMEREDRDYMGCRVELVADDGTVARYRQATGFPVARYVEGHDFAPTCCLVTRRRVFEDVGRFDGRLHSNGDLEFGRRVRAAGYDLVFEPDVTLYHPARSTVRELLVQNVRIGRGREEVRVHHGNRLDVRAPLDPRNFLPVDPRGFRAEVSHAHGSVGELCGWYLLACVLKWARTTGYLREHVSNRLP